MEKAKTTFGRRLRLIRKNRGLTLEQLGEAAGLGYKHIADIERGQKAPSFDAIDRLAEALGVRAYELFVPPGAEQADLDAALSRIMTQVGQDSSPAAKRFLLVVLSLVRGLETELPGGVTNSVIESLDKRGLLGPITVIGHLGGGPGEAGEP